MRSAEKVVVMTGAAQGIGVVVARQIAAEGGTVVLAHRSELLKDVHREILVDGATARYFLCGYPVHGLR